MQKVTVRKVIHNRACNVLDWHAARSCCCILHVCGGELGVVGKIVSVELCDWGTGTGVLPIAAVHSWCVLLGRARPLVYDHGLVRSREETAPGPTPEIAERPARPHDVRRRCLLQTSEAGSG